MKICPKCNAQMPDDTKFCNNCGTSLADVAPALSGNNDNNNSQQSGSPFPMPVFNSNTDNSQNQGMNQGNMNSFGQGNSNNFGQGNNNNFGPGNMDQQQPQPGMNPLFSAPPAEEPKKNKKTGLFMIIGGVAACLVIALVVVLVLVLGGGYKQPVNKLVSLVNSKSMDVNAYMACVAPSFVPETYKEALTLIKGGDAKSELDDAIKDAFDDAFDSLEDEFGKDWKVSVEWKKNKKLSDKDIEDLQGNYDSLTKMLSKADLDDEDTWEDIADMLDDEYDSELNTAKAVKAAENLLKKMENFKITEGYEVKVKVTISGKKNSESETMEANVVKANGKWFIDPLSFSEGGVSLSNYTYLLNNL